MSTDKRDDTPRMRLWDDRENARKAKTAILILTEAFDAVMDAGQITVHAQTSHVFHATFGWWAWIMRSSKAAVLLHDNGLDHEADPIIRSILQHALVLQWVIDVGDQALEAVAEHGENEQRRFFVHAQRAGWPSPEAVGAPVAPKPDTPHPLLPMVKNFAELCRAYDAQTAYVAFSLYSAHVHPSVQGAMAYLDDQTGLRGTPAPESYSGLLHTAACSIQTTKTINRLIAGQPFDQAISRAEQALGTRIDPPALRPEHRPPPPSTS
ncbi:hypothetical protein FHX81_7970 [Saccharothrix saharensis]|uniref:Uncharacterized protein n=1 Tax=Saccharothrix saharensis TaxID=571190 RepID=A0A543JRV7_9PSEU|nr:DUF5677 domain-containing protein [Saccharothrix saharensis]TQM85485.1 hypothetical protein FHX81_7970 [Saccharothrix saharensis]